MASTAPSSRSRRRPEPPASVRPETFGQASARLALSKPDAAKALDISINSFERHVQPELRVVRRGKLRLFPVEELERWLRENAERILEEQ